MRYASETISTTVSRLNNQYFLPAIQREFVWAPEQILSLFDSIMRGYPIGSFLFWELKPENRDNWEAYRFIEDASDGGTHNTLANTTGVQRLTLILDGQQRLTSLLIGLRGSYSVKKKWKRKNNPDAWAKMRLYLDLLHDPKVQEDEGTAGIYFSFRFFSEEPENDAEHHWIRVGSVMDWESDDAFDAARQAIRDGLPGDVTKAQMSNLDRNIDRLYRSFWKDDVVSYYIERDQDYDRVLDIFVRANEGGTKLSKSDLLLSMVTSKWEGMNAREEIYGFVDRLNTELTRRNDFDKDFIMKSCLVVTDLPIAYKVQHFNNTNLALIRSKWDDIKRAVERAVDLVNSFGIDRNNLTSVNALIPVSYYLMRNPTLQLRGTRPEEVENAKRVRRWLIPALLRGVFSGSSDTILGEIRETIRTSGAASANFPITAINDVVAKSGRGAAMGDYFLATVLALTYGREQTFLALSLLYDETAWGAMTHHQDHIFPRAMFAWKELEKRGLTPERIIHLQSVRDRLGNLELLVDAENLEKSDMEFDKWITTRDASFKAKHLIPPDASLYTFEKFEEFVTAREALIRDRLTQVLGAEAVTG